MSTESAPVRLQGVHARTRHPDTLIAELASEQHGVVARRQLLDMGLGRDAIGGRLENGRLHRLHRGVYAVGHRVVSQEGRWIAAVLASGPDAVLSHWSAAAYWALRPNSRTGVEVTVAHQTRSSELIHRHVSVLPDDERTVRDAIPVTSVPRTIFDLAATESPDVVEAMLREAEYQRLDDRLSLPDLVRRYPGRRGVRRVSAALRRLESLPSGRIRSPLEERFMSFLRRHGLPRPRLNDWIVLDGNRFQVDCHWPACRQIVELDGWQGHGTRSSFQSDRSRDRALRVAGYSVIHLTWSQLEDEPGAIAADLRKLLGSDELVQYNRT